MLKLKSILYRYTGIYLAHSELAKYLAQPEVQECAKYTKNCNGEFVLREYEEELICSVWQAKHGFCRPMSFLRFKRPRAFWCIVAWFVDFYTVLKWDIQNLIRKLK